MKERRAWIDAARGVALAFVVLLHVSARLEKSGFVRSEWLEDLNAVLDGFRMPMLVALSGLLAAGIGTWTFADVARRRVGPLLVMYASWAVVLTLVTLVLIGDSEGAVSDLSSAAWLPYGQLWYLVALPVYIALAWALRSVPTSVLVPVAFAVFLLSRIFWGETVGLIGNWSWVASHWVYFVCAQRWASGYTGLAERATPRRAVGALALFGAVAAVAVGLDLATNALMLVPLSIAGTLAGLVGSGAWGQAAWLRWARAVGRRSLGVYASHAAIATAVALIIGDRFPSFRGGGIVVPLFAAAVTIAAAYALTVALARWAPVPLLSVWWDTAARTPVADKPRSSAQAQ